MSRALISTIVAMGAMASIDMGLPSHYIPSQRRSSMPLTEGEQDTLDAFPNTREGRKAKKQYVKSLREKYR